MPKNYFRCIVILCTTFVLAMALSKTAMAGNGTFKDGKFNFCVSVRFDATEAELERIRNGFQIASQVLADATDGQHRFGTITIVNNSGASQSAEYWVNPGVGKAYALGPRYGTHGEHVMLYFDIDFLGGDSTAYTIAHEHAHHAYGVHDEYKGPLKESGADCAPRPDTDTLSFCLMDNYFIRGGRAFSLIFTLNEFCVESNHDPDGNTDQSSVNREACWKTISRNPNYPAKRPSDLPTDEPPEPHDVTFEMGIGDLRVVLLLDRSFSMAFSNRLLFARRGAADFIGLVDNGDSLGVVSFNHSASTEFPLTTITDDDTRLAAKAAVNSLLADGSTDIGGGLLKAIDQFSDQSTPSCNQVIILLSDGEQNTGTNPEDVITRLQDEGITVITIGMGDAITMDGENLLQNIASRTGGRYFAVEDSLDLIHLFLQLAMESTGSGLLTRAPEPITSGQDKEQLVLVESGAVNATFAITAEDASAFTLSLISPSGAVITEANAFNNSSVGFIAGLNSRILRVPAPEAGIWKIRVSAIALSDPSTQNITILAFAKQDGVQLNPSVKKNGLVFPEAVEIQATPRFRGESVVGATIRGKVTRPDGSQVPIELFDDGLVEHGDAIADDGAYAARFNQYLKNGTYTFDLTVMASGAKTFAGEDIFAAPSNAKPVPAFTRTASTTVVVTGVPEADLSISQTVFPDEVVTGTNLTYKITINNQGPDTATATTVIDNLPAALTFVSCIATDGGICSGSGNKQTVTFASLASGASAAITLVATVNCSLIDGAVISNTAAVGSATPDPNLVNNRSMPVTITVSNPAPVIACPADITVVTAKLGDIGAVVNYPVPLATDNCPVTVFCSTPSGSSFPLGTTTITCTATDQAGAKAGCSFLVTVFDVSLQDDRSGDTLLFNSLTGDYKFTRCGAGGFTLIGRGRVNRTACLTTLTDSKVTATLDHCIIAPLNRGSAIIRPTPFGATFLIKDSSTNNNISTCP